MNNNPIYVTVPNLPPLEEFIPYLREVWDRKILTNGGPAHQELERALCRYLGVEHVSLFTNATLALVTALQALDLEGEVITTPYSFVATAHSLVWNNLKPVFVDVDPVTLNMDPARIEAAITAATTAILPVHCYGYPCEVEAIQRIADRHGLKVLYDAAHAFGVKYKGQSLLNYGDLSVLSFHATKVFNTFEGGAIVCRDAETKRRIDSLKNFGYVDETTVESFGINAKMSEIHAAFGLLQLKYVDTALEKRRLIDAKYREALAGVDGIYILPHAEGQDTSFSYFPVRVQASYPLSRDGLYDKLKKNDVFARRYFYPLISQFGPYVGFQSAEPGNLPVADAAAKEILCLPIYPDLSPAQLEFVIGLITGR